jgi:hypothetical protein
MISEKFDEEALLADDCELISHETLQQYVNDLGLLGEDMFEPDSPEERQWKLREELKPEKRKLEKILREESNKKQATSPFNPNHWQMSIKHLSIYKEREKRCISKENTILIQQVKCVPTKKKSIVWVSDDKPDIKSRKRESTKKEAYFHDRNKFVSSSNLLTSSIAKVIQELDEKRNYPVKRKLELDAQNIENRPENKKNGHP